MAIVLTGTPLSSCILYLRSAAGLPVKSSTMKNMLAITKVAFANKHDPTRTKETRNNLYKIM